MSALKYFCDIIKTEMELDDDQVYLWDQKINIPPDSRLYVAVGVLSCKPFSNTRSMVGDSGGLDEYLSVNMHATLSVDIFSRNTDARERKEEVILALRSIYSQQLQETYAFYVAPISTGFVNLSQIEGSAIPYRFNITLAIQYVVTKNKAVDFFDDFTDTVTTEA